MESCVGDEREEILNILECAEQFHHKNCAIPNDNGTAPQNHGETQW